MTFKFVAETKVLLGLIVIFFMACPAFSAQGVSITKCVDISSQSKVYRVLKLIATPVDASEENYFSLTGKHIDIDGKVIGLAVGTGQVNDEGLLLSVSAAATTGTDDIKSMSYMVDLDLASFRGSYREMIQGAGGITTISGKAALLDCGLPLTDFNDQSNGEVDCNDYDGDGVACVPVWGGVMQMADCNNDDGSIFPGAQEICDDGIDQNCNGKIDENCDPDNDKDGYPASQDCNDDDDQVHPGAIDYCNDLIDQDCSGAALRCDDPSITCTDFDHDGYYREGGVCGPIDCQVGNPTVHPNAKEVCGDGIDQNCIPGDDLCTTYPEFTENNNDTMSQGAEGLVWQKDHYNPLNSALPRKTWSEASKYCDDLDFAGKTDWRLPTVVELLGIVDMRFKPTIDSRFKSTNATYWTSTGDLFRPEESSYTVDFSTGRVSLSLKSSLLNLIRCVR